MKKKKYSTQTRLVHDATGHRQPGLGLGTVNPPIYRGSTLLYDDFSQIAEWNERRKRSGEVGYGIMGSDTTMALEEILAELDGGSHAVATSSGLSAVSLALTACLESGDHLLIADNVYGPARLFADGFLKKYGVETTFFDPLDLGTTERMIQSNTTVIYFETPGSLTFEMPDARGLYSLARKHKIISIVDTTWPTSLYYPAVKEGADISLAAGTKYYAGHSDAFFGIVIGNEKVGPMLRHQSTLMGNHVGPDDVYLALRGLRTLKVRLDAISKSAVKVAKYLEKHPKIMSVRHPALPKSPGHEHWKEQFTGSTGLFGAFLSPKFTRAASERMVESLELFGIGYSWGGFESLAVLYDLPAYRSAPDWDKAFKDFGPLLRLQIGLEEPDELISDLNKALEALS